MGIRLGGACLWGKIHTYACVVQQTPLTTNSHWNCYNRVCQYNKTHQPVLVEIHS